MRKALFVVVAFVLAACGQATTATTATTTGPAANAPTSDPQTSGKPVVESGGKPTAPLAAAFGAQTLIGRWGDNGDCSKSLVQFNADGTFHSFDTNGDGRWALNGDHLTMQGEGGTFELGLHWTDANHMDVQNSDGSMGRSQRC